MAVLKLGDEGAEVANLQRALKELGHRVTPDGDFGKRTKRTVQIFQKKHGLTPDGVVGPATYAKIDEVWQPGVNNISSSGHLEPAELAKLDKNSERRLKDLHPRLAQKCRQIIALAAAEGVDLRVSQGVRTFAQQDALYRKRPRVTRARGGQSIHNYGMAADFVIISNGRAVWTASEYDRIAGWADTVGGIESGARWRFKDRPHIQLAGIGSYRKLLDAYNRAGKGQAGIEAAWKLVGA